MLRQRFREHIVAGAGQSVMLYTAVIFFVSGFSVRSQTDNNVTRTDIGVVDDIGALHAASHGRVYDNGMDQVAYIGSPAAGGINAYSHNNEARQQSVRSVDDGRNDFSGNEQFAVSDGG